MAMTAADRIEEISPTVILVFVMVAAAIFQAVDILIPRIGMGPLYLILVGLVAWRLGPRVSIVATIVAIALSMPSAVHSGGPASPAIMTIRVAIRCGVLAFVFMTMKALRRAYDRERAAARLDGMTGLLNKASFGVEMDRILSAGSKPLVVGSIDLDHFKQVNDDHGHAAGDRAIRAVATAATSIVGKDGHVGRIGGDEFAFVRRVDSVENGRDLAQAIHHAVSQALVAIDLPTTVSMGVVVRHVGDNRDRNALLLRSDGLLYAAKRAGKASVVIADTASDAVASPDVTRVVRLNARRRARIV